MWLLLVGNASMVGWVGLEQGSDPFCIRNLTDFKLTNYQPGKMHAISNIYSNRQESISYVTVECSYCQQLLMQSKDSSTLQLGLFTLEPVHKTSLYVIIFNDQWLCVLTVKKTFKLVLLTGNHSQHTTVQKLYMHVIYRTMQFSTYRQLMTE